MKALAVLVLMALAVAVGAAGASYILVCTPDSDAARALRRLVEQRGPAAAEVVKPVAAAVSDVAEVAVDATKKASEVVDPWQGLAKENWYSGPKLNQRAFAGRVALIGLWNAENAESVVSLQRLEQLWNAFRAKQLVVVGSHRGGRTVKSVAAVKASNVTFSLYDGARYAKEPKIAEQELPFYYVVDHVGKVVYAGRSDRAATAVLADALTTAELARRKLGN